MQVENNYIDIRPQKQLDSSKVFGISKKILVPYFSEKSELVPEVDEIPF